MAYHRKFMQATTNFTSTADPRIHNLLSCISDIGPIVFV